jgi:hypothetical protein
MKAKFIALAYVMLAVVAVSREVRSQTTGAPETSERQSSSMAATPESLAPATVYSGARYTFPVLGPLVVAPAPAPGQAVAPQSLDFGQNRVVAERSAVAVEELLPVPVNPGNLLMPDHGENPTLGFGFGVPLAGLASAGNRGILARTEEIPTSGPVVLFRTAIVVNADVLYDTGFQPGFSPGAIALRGSDDWRKSGQFNLQESSADLTSDVQVPGLIFPLQGFFQGEVGPDGLVVRQAFGRVGNLLAGSNWTSFEDPDMLPRTIANTVNKAPAGAAFRPSVAQFQYMLASDRGWALGTAIEQSVNDDFELNPPNTPTANNVRLHRYPDLVSRLRYLHSDGWGKSQVAVLVRAQGYEDTAFEEHFVTGWGVSGSTRFKTWGDDNIRMGVTGGQGIGSYLFGLETAPSSVFDNGDLRPLPCIGTYAGYQHLWTPHVWSTLACGYGQTDTVLDRFADAPQRVKNGWANLVWSVNKNCAAAIEYTYGAKEAWDGRTGENHQIMLSVQIGTQAAPSGSAGSASEEAGAASAAGSAAFRDSESAPATSAPLSRPGYSMRM